MRLIAGLLLLLTLPAIARADSLPTFDGFRVDEVYQGPLARPILRTKEAKDFRTRLKDGSRERPNFAGRFHLIRWGCGTSCAQGAVVDAETGRVVFLPFSICCYEGPMDTPNWDSIDGKLNSNLIIFHGKRNEEGVNGDHYYAFDGRHFRFLATKEVKAASTDAAPAVAPPVASPPPVSARPKAAGTEVKAIPAMFQGTWKAQGVRLSACQANGKEDEKDASALIVTADNAQAADGLGAFYSATISTSDSADGLAINSMTITLNYGDHQDDMKTETWSVKDVDGHKVLIILHTKNMTFDLLTKCSG